MFNHNGIYIMRLQRLNWIILAGAIFTMLPGSQPASAGCVVGVSEGNRLNVRTGPSKYSRVVAAIPADTCGVRVSRECQSNWCRVSIGRVRGWASMKFLDRDRASPKPTVQIAAPAVRSTGTDWKFLGARKINFRNDRDVIPVGKLEGRFSALQLSVKNAGVRFNKVTVVYNNGKVDEFPVTAQIVPGQNSPILDLKGRRRIIKQINLSYRSRPGASEQAEVQVFGLAARIPAAPKTPIAAIDTWVQLGIRDVSYITERDVIRVGRAAGKFQAIQLLVAQTGVFLEDLKVVYGNETVDDIQIRRKIPRHGRTRVIKLRGGSRGIKEIRLIYRARPTKSAPASVAVYGLRARS